VQPNTLIESSATENHALGSPKMWRKASVLTDSILGILSHDPDKCSGNQFIDEDFLRDWMDCKDFSKYQCVPGKMERVVVLLLGDGVMLTVFCGCILFFFFFVTRP